MIDTLAPVTLDELNEAAALQTRRDRKYVLTPDELDDLLAALPPARVLEIDGSRSFAYDSTYFDTPELDAYRLAATRRRRRFKVRTRTYVDTGTCFVEVKTRAGRGTTVKERQPHDDADHLGPARTFVSERLADAGAPSAPVLAPTLRSRYHRTTLLLDDARVTLDTGLVWDLLLPAAPDNADAGLTDADHTGAGSADASVLRSATIGDLVVVETKTAAGSGPSSVDRLLWRAGHRPDRISKYATGLAVLEPGLPDMPWRRLVRRRLTVSAPTTARHLLTSERTPA
ncbi:polyphosphate polymerase domain-containing protein [Promicromonospora sp. NPDC060204]|uniref:polyphosphate polymerase domain-containing protein n=1 Tax=Promicromonospora sp. NPDC060204 TaxID=3347071 RepID=UPI00364B0E29